VALQTDTSVTQESTKRIIQTKEFKVQINEAGTGHPVIMLHGTGPGATGWSNFYPNVGPLAKEFRAIALTFPGWGESSEIALKGETRAAVNARAVKQVMDELGLEKAALVGNSMGGAATLQFVADYPDRISHCITMGAGAPGVNVFTPSGAPTEGIRILGEAYRDPSPENFRRLVTIMVYNSAFVTDELVKARSDAALANRTHLANWLKPGPMGQPPVEKLQSYAGPSLFIHGRDDRTMPMEASLRLLSIFPNSRLHVFNRCGHWAQIEHADEFNWLVTEFIKRTS
jgi:2-hydroxy-6-oxonona-2,4-dienedioate hydrolase